MPSKTRDIFEFFWVFISATTVLFPIDIWIKILIVLSALPTIVCKLSGIANKTPVKKVLLAVWSSFTQPYLMLGLTVCGLLIQMPTNTILFVFPLYLFSLPLMLYVMRKWLYKSILESWQEEGQSHRPFIRTSW